MYRVIKPFDYYHDGITRTHYGEGLVPLPDDAAVVAIGQGWAEKVEKAGTTYQGRPGRKKKG